MDILNIAAYKFVGIPDPDAWLEPLKQRCLELNMKGTVIVAPEGINLFLAAERPQIDAFLDFLRNDPLFENRFTDIEVKESVSGSRPFRKMVVRKAREII